jgi:hypothetical protein
VQRIPEFPPSSRLAESTQFRCHFSLKTKQGEQKTMYALWLTLGTAIADSNFIGSLPRKPFQFVTRIVQDYPGAGLVKVRVPRGAGLVVQADMDDLRLQIVTALRNKYGSGLPPIGVYVAARLCQLLNLPTFSRQDDIQTGRVHDFIFILGLANSAYLASGAASAPGLNAFLAACLLDQRVLAGLQPANPSAEVAALAGEFGLSSSQLTTAQTFAQNTAAKEAARLLMLTQDGPWEDGACPEVALFWRGNSEHILP